MNVDVFWRRVGGELRADMEEGEEVVDGLGEDTRPVDRVNCTESVSGVEFSVAEQGLDDILGTGKG